MGAPRRPSGLEVQALSFAIDANILLHASNSASAEHPLAVEFLESVAQKNEVVCFAWTTLMSFLRISTNPAIFPAPLTVEAAEANVAALLSLTHARLLVEQDGFWEVYREVSRDVRPRGNLVPDTHLAALLKHSGVRVLYTNDADFRRFEFLELRNPLAG
ncbi:MAG: TA system VapC family ribonuclease toxin [Myxococcota bacterium]